MVLMLLTALAYSHTPDHLNVAYAVFGFSWVAQFLGHGVAEKRAPALIDNLIGGEFRRVCIHARS
jgi:uncharacterized membrane protein YGL010W